MFSDTYLANLAWAAVNLLPKHLFDVKLSRQFTFPLSCLLITMALLTGCAMVSVSSVDSRDYVKQRRGDVLTTGEFSQYSLAVLQILGQERGDCEKQAADCAEMLHTALGLTMPQRLSAMSELWMYQALALGKRPLQGTEEEVNAYLMSARYAYAYLFFSGVAPTQRVFEDRQTQVRDYYNFAVQQVAVLLFEHQHKVKQQRGRYQIANWQIDTEFQHSRYHPQRLPEQLLPAAALSFKGIRNQFRRDGLGAELVAVAATPIKSEAVYSMLPTPVVTALLAFNGNTLSQLLSSSDVTLALLDPLQQAAFQTSVAQVPLAANFTAGYGLWLARSDFSRQAFRNLMGSASALQSPHIFMLQPYDPNRKIILMLHGIASSPEAWVNTANEVLGDAALRERYQLWQLYYPTNLPLIINLQSIRETVLSTLEAVDPAAAAAASDDMVIIGHSMGGLLARLLVSEDDGGFLDRLSELLQLDPSRKRRLANRFSAELTITPLPGVTRAVFIAAPHRGTSVADYRLARWLAGLITLPVTVIEKVHQFAEVVLDPEQQIQPAKVRFTSIDNLSEHDSFIRAAVGLPINSRVKYHSIIAVEQPALPVEQQSDGVVPYLSAHLDGAESEMVIRSGHSVQETSAAILEIRRILYQHLTELP
ncbi:esterase/lipase family protein [Alishewanella longhuensis]